MILVAVVWFGVKKIEDLHTQVDQLTEKSSAQSHIEPSIKRYRRTIIEFSSLPIK